jgi:hypothetical protein
MNKHMCNAQQSTLSMRIRRCETQPLYPDFTHRQARGERKTRSIRDCGRAVRRDLRSIALGPS